MADGVIDEPIPKGIKAFVWTNSDGSESLRYRVRIRRKTINYDETFISLKNAIEARIAVLSGKPVEKRPTMTPEQKEQYFKEKENPLLHDVGRFFLETNFRWFCEQYFEKKLEGRSDKPTAGTNELSEQYRIKSILQTPVEFKRPTDMNLSGVWETMLMGSKVKFGEIPAKFINHLVINSFILESLKKKAKSSVRRDLNTISAVINYTIHFAPEFYKENWLINPVKLADKSRLAGHNNPQNRRISEDTEKEILKALQEYSNKEVLQIFILALLTGARRSEILFLTWDKVRDNIIILENTKNGRTREAVITDEAKEILESIPKIDDRLFHYSVYGFNSVWQRIKKKSKIDNLKFHDCRREFIASCIELMNGNIIAIANMTGMTDMNHLEKVVESLEPANLNTEKGLQKQVGQSSRKMLRHYASGLLNINNKDTPKQS
jgi:integrase